MYAVPIAMAMVYSVSKPPPPYDPPPTANAPADARTSPARRRPLTRGTLASGAAGGVRRGAAPVRNVEEEAAAQAQTRDVGQLMSWAREKAFATRRPRKTLAEEDALECLIITPRAVPTRPGRHAS